VHEGTVDRELKFFIGSRMGDSRRPVQAQSIMVLPMPTEVWGFFFNDCIYESAPALVSLHVTKRGAVRAMIAHQNELWEDALSPGDSHIHCAFRANTRAVRLDLVRSNLRMSRAHVAKVKIEQS